MQTQNTLLSANWEKSTYAIALGNESFTRPWSRLPFFVGSPKHLRHFHYRSAATHLQPDNTELWQRLSTAQNIRQKSCILSLAKRIFPCSHENAGRLGPCCGKTANPWEQNCNLLGQNSCPCGQKEILVMCKQEERREWNHKLINPNQPTSPQSPPLFQPPNQNLK